MKIDVEKIDWSLIGVCKAMVYYLIGNLKRGFDDLIAKNENNI